MTSGRRPNDEYYGTILRVILFTGLREGEALGLTWDCVNFKYGTVVISRQLQRRPQDDGVPATDSNQEREVPHTSPEQVGHEPVENPLYGHVSDRMQRASAGRMEEYIASISRMKSA